jgi:hypothetical protein
MFILVILILVVFLSQFDASNNLISYKIRSSSSLFVVTSTQLIQLFANSDGESFYYLECHANGAIGIQSLLDTLGMPNSPLLDRKASNFNFSRQAARKASRMLVSFKGNLKVFWTQNDPTWFLCRFILILAQAPNVEYLLPIAFVHEEGKASGLERQQILLNTFFTL